MATAPGPPAAPRTGRTIHLSDLLRRPITDSQGESLGRVKDVVVRFPGHPLPVVKGLVAKVGSGREVYVPVEQRRVRRRGTQAHQPQARPAPFERREGEVLLRADVLGHRLIDVPSAHLIRASDLELREQWSRRAEEWVLAGVDTRRRTRAGCGAGAAGAAATRPGRAFRDWAKFEPLIGHAGSPGLRGPFARIRRLKPAQIADLLEDASKEEENEILDHVHADPELEADVFEELDEDLATRLLAPGARRGHRRGAGQDAGRRRGGHGRRAAAAAPAARTGPAAAGPAHQGAHADGIQPGSAGGLMGVDFLDVPAEASVADALAAVGRARKPAAGGADQRARRRQRGRLCGVATVVPWCSPIPRPGSGHLRRGPGPGRRGHGRGRRRGADERLQPDHGSGGRRDAG